MESLITRWLNTIIIVNAVKNLVLNNVHKHMHSNVSVKTSAGMPRVVKIDLMILFVEVVINLAISMCLE